jgi:outer membrane protein assembly factor BamA
MLLFPRYLLLAVLFVVCILRAHTGSAQSYALRLHAVESADADLTREAALQPVYPSPATALAAAQDLIPSLQERGYLAASLDSIKPTETGYDAFVFLGSRYRWARVSLGALPPGLLVEASVHPAQWEGRPLSPKDLSRLTERLLRWTDEHGYPFAAAGLQEATIDSGGGVAGKFVLQPGPRKIFDTVTITGDLRVSRSFLLRYLDLKEGEPYSERKLATLSNRLRELSFLQEAQPWEVQFQVHRTSLHLFLKERRANQLNAVLGLLPNQGETGKLLLTGDAQAVFQNALSLGESFSLTYQNLQPRSPRLQVEAAVPYILSSSIGVDARFEFYRRDSLWRRTFLQAGARYAFSATDVLRVFFSTTSSRLGTVDTALVRLRRQLPDEGDVSTQGFGLEVLLNRTDFRLAPRRGFHLRAGGTGSQRRLLPNDAILDLRDGSGYDYARLYDSVGKVQTQARLEGDAAVYRALGKRVVLKGGYAGGFLSGKTLFRNELFQIGGFRLLRGFDEQSIFASQYHIGTLEARLILGGTSYVYLFSDNAWVESRYGLNNRAGLYNGFGVGTTLQTKTGLFSIAYAVGRSPDEGVQLRRSKVHFGYVAVF